MDGAIYLITENIVTRKKSAVESHEVMPRVFWCGIVENSTPRLHLASGRK